MSSILRGPAANCYERNFEAATPWNDIRTGFIERFLDGTNKFCHWMEKEHCNRQNGKEIRNFIHRIKRKVDKDWPDEMNGIPGAQPVAERGTQCRQRRQRYMDYSLRGLRPKYLQRKVQEYLLEHPNATFKNYSTHIIRKHVNF